MKLYALWLITASLCSAIGTPNQHILKAEEDTTRPQPGQSKSPRNILDDALASLPYTSSPPTSKEHPRWPTSFFSHRINTPETLPHDLSQLPPFHRPLLPPHRHPPSNKTIYELISASKHTSVLAHIVNDDPLLLRILNSTSANITFFAPTNTAFHGHDLSSTHKHTLRTILTYHIVPDIYSASRLFTSHTLPTALTPPAGTKTPQRLAIRASWKGLSLNFHSRIIATDLKASNGIIHPIDDLLTPPPNTLSLLDLIPSHFSTFTLALQRTGLIQTLNTNTTTTKNTTTLIVPTNAAFTRLSYPLNAFLFAPKNKPYLLALLKYHMIPNQALYSDMLYTATGETRRFAERGVTHLNLQTGLVGRKVRIEVARFGAYAGVKVDGDQRVGFVDGLAEDGNVFVVERVLIPPAGGRRIPGEERGVTVEELKRRLGEWV